MKPVTQQFIQVWRVGFEVLWTVPGTEMLCKDFKGPSYLNEADAQASRQYQLDKGQDPSMCEVRLCDIYLPQGATAQQCFEAMETIVWSDS